MEENLCEKTKKTKGMFGWAMAMEKAAVSCEL
jgi:hypothetical protein